MDRVTSQGGGFTISKQLEKPHSHPRPALTLAATAVEIERLEDGDDMMTAEAGVEAGARANRRWQHDQLAWCSHDETGDDGDGGEGMSNDGGVLSADERKCSRVGFGGSARCRSFEDDKRVPSRLVRAFSCLAWVVDAHTHLCGGSCRCEHVLRIDRCWHTARCQTARACT